MGSFSRCSATRRHATLVSIVCLRVTVTCALIAQIPASASGQQREDPEVAAFRGIISQSRATAASMRREVDQARRGLAKNPPERIDLTFTGCTGSKRLVTLSQAQSIVADVDRYIAKLDAAVPEVTRRIRQIRLDQSAFKKAGFDTDVRGILHWQGLSEEARRDFKKANTLALFDSILGAIGGAAGIAKLDEPAELVAYLRKPAVKRALRRLRVDPGRMVAAARKLARATTNKDKALALELFTDFLGKIKSALAIGFSKTDAEVLIGVFTTAASWLVGSANPAYGFLLSELEWATAGVHNFFAQWGSRRYIDKITRQTELKLKGIKALQRVLSKHVGEYKTYMEGLANQCVK